MKLIHSYVRKLPSLFQSSLVYSDPRNISSAYKFIKDLRSSEYNRVWAGYTRFNETHFRSRNNLMINEATWTTNSNTPLSSSHNLHNPFVIASKNGTYRTVVKLLSYPCICRFLLIGNLLLFVFMSLVLVLTMIFPINIIRKRCC